MRYSLIKIKSNNKPKNVLLNQDSILQFVRFIINNEVLGSVSETYSISHTLTDTDSTSLTKETVLKVIKISIN